MLRFMHEEVCEGDYLTAPVDLEKGRLLPFAPTWGEVVHLLFALAWGISCFVFFVAQA